MNARLRCLSRRQDRPTFHHGGGIVGDGDEGLAHSVGRAPGGMVSEGTPDSATAKALRMSRQHRTSKRQTIIAEKS